MIGVSDPTTYCVCGNPDGTNRDCERCMLIAANVDLRAEVERLKALEPKWLEPGKLPDAEGWWLWTGAGIGVEPLDLTIRDGRPWDLVEQCFVSAYVNGSDRFAPMPKWEGPK